MRTTLSFILLIGSFAILLFNSCRKDNYLDEEGDLLRKSFPEIFNLQSKAFSKTEARVNFNIKNEELNDTITEKIVRLFPGELIEERVPINHVQNNFKVLENLEPGKMYPYDIEVKTKNDVFTSAHRDTFYTPTIDLVMDTILEVTEELRLTASAIYKDWEESDKRRVKGLGHKWSNGSDDLLTYAPNMYVNDEGVFRSELRLFDISKNYTVEAFVVLEGEPDTIWSLDSKSHQSNSRGDFWVNMNHFGIYNSMINGFDNDANPFQDLEELKEGLEGAVSFVINGHAYIGLGRKSNGDYNNKFYKYYPLQNRWEEVREKFPGKARMFASAFVLNNKAYVGLGCSTCEGYDNYHSLGEINTANEIQQHKNIYVFNANETWSQEMKLPPEAKGRFASYSFVQGNNAYVGGGLVKSIVEGDIPNTDSEMNQIDEMEWHDLNNNGYVDSYNPRRELMLTNETISTDWIDAERRIPFCENCGCMNPSCTVKENIIAVIRDIDQQQGGVGIYDMNLIGEISKEEYFNSSFSGISLQTEVRINGSITAIWKDHNNNGIIESIELNTTISEDDKIEIVNKWVDRNKDLTVDLDLGTIWRDSDGDAKVDLIELLNYSGASNQDIFWTEWLDSDTDNVVDPDELFQGLNADRGLWKSEFNGSNFEMVSSSLDSRFGAVSLSLSSANSVVISGANWRTPTSYDLIAKVAKFNGTSWVSNSTPSDFKPRIHAAGFVIDGSGYIAGGEAENGLALNFDIWKYKCQNGNNCNLDRLTGCGITSMTRGIGFSYDGRGYVGFGKVQGNVSSEFWMYIPPN